MKNYTTILKTILNTRTKKIAAYVAAVLFWFVIWHIAAVFINETIILPKPFLVLKTLYTLSFTGAFWEAILNTLIRIITGYLAGFVFGVILAVLTYKYALLKILFYPLISTIKATPVASFIILALMWLKTGQLSIFITFLMTVPLIWANVYAGIESTDNKLLEMGSVFKFNRAKQIRYIILPAVLPFLLSAATTALGFAWKSGVAAEVLGAVNNTIGGQLFNSKIYLDMPNMFAWTITVILLSVLLEKGFVKLTVVIKNNLYMNSKLNLFGNCAVQGRRPPLYEDIAREDNEAMCSFRRGLFKSKQEMSILSQENHAETEKYPKTKSVENCISIQSLNKSYGQTKVLDNFSYDFPPNGIVYIGGRSGSGKTTLLRILAKLETPDSGIIKNIDDRKISMVFQEDRLLKELTAINNINVILQDKTKIFLSHHFLKLTGLSEWEDADIAELSGGMARRVAIARALTYGGDILLMDEPFKGIDEKALQPILAEIEKISETTLILIVTHEVPDSTDNKIIF